ncbi:MAG: hypothetical protein Q7T82_05720 [Armatimonadota bacterium]|nr:hypothetical protein [Armatimonadota bacterium]
MRLVKASILTIVIVFAASAYILSELLTWDVVRNNLVVPLIVGVVPCVIGVLTGAIGFYLTRTLLGQRFLVRILSAVICGLLAAVIDAVVFLRTVESSPSNAAIYAAQLIGVAYTVLIATIVGVVFGAGAGQRKRRAGGETRRTVNNSNL